MDKIWIVLSVTIGGISTFSHMTVVGAPVEIRSAGFTFVFSLATRSTTKNKKKKYDKILILTESKLNNIETLVSQEIIDMERIHVEFITVLKEKSKYEKK